MICYSCNEIHNLSYNLYIIFNSSKELHFKTKPKFHECYKNAFLVISYQNISVLHIFQLFNIPLSLSILTGLPLCVDTENTTPRYYDPTHKIFESLQKEFIPVNSGGKTMYSLSKLAVILVVIVLHL